MTDNDIIKALEEWIKELKDDYKRLQLLDAPMDCFEESHIDNIRVLSNALDIINRQKAELTQYAHDQHELMIEKDKLFDIAEKQKEEIERLKDDIKKLIDNKETVVIDLSRVKEMVDVSNPTESRVISPEMLSVVARRTRAEAITEFAERAKQLVRGMVDVMWDGDMVKCRVNGCRKPSHIPCGSEICIEENKVLWTSDIDQIAKEMKGEQ